MVETKAFDLKVLEPSPFMAVIKIFNFSTDFLIFILSTSKSLDSNLLLEQKSNHYGGSMNRFLTIAFLFMTLIACGKKDSPKSEVQGISPTVDKLTSTQWCSINKINQEFQVVSRYQFTRGEPNSFTVSYLGMN